MPRYQFPTLLTRKGSPTLLALMILLSGCTDCKQELADLRAENERLKAQLAASQKPAATSEATTVKTTTTTTTTSSPTSSQGTSAPSTASTSSTTSTPSPSASHTPSFTDISGNEAEKDINNLAALGVLDSTSGKFSPNDPITRADYVRWLVKADNIYFADQQKNRIKLASDSTAPTFKDVDAKNPDFTYIQGLADAGYIVGVDKTHFAPDKSLTREQMIGIKAQVDEGSAIDKYPGVKSFIKVSDVDAIDDAYADAIHEDTSARTTNNFSRIWGNTKLFKPKALVTRAEAATSLVQIGTLSDRKANAEDVLKAKK